MYDDEYYENMDEFYKAVRNFKIGCGFGLIIIIVIILFLIF